MIIEIKNLKKIYAGRTVVDVADLQFNQGETIGLVGIMVPERQLYSE